MTAGSTSSSTTRTMRAGGSHLTTGTRNRSRRRCGRWPGAAAQVSYRRRFLVGTGAARPDARRRATSSTARFSGSTMRLTRSRTWRWRRACISLLRGNTLRAGATLDAIARGDAPPPDLDVVQTPRAGTSFTHRLLAVAAGNRSAGLDRHAAREGRAAAEFVGGALLGDPSRVRARAHFVDARGGCRARRVRPRHAGGSRRSICWRSPDSAGLAGELGDRLRSAAAQARPAPVAMTRPWNLSPSGTRRWAPTVISVSEFLSLAQAVTRLSAAPGRWTPQDLVPPGTTPARSTPPN